MRENIKRKQPEEKDEVEPSDDEDPFDSMTKGKFITIITELLVHQRSKT